MTGDSRDSFDPLSWAREDEPTRRPDNPGPTFHPRSWSAQAQPTEERTNLAPPRVAPDEPTRLFPSTRGTALQPWMASVAVVLIGAGLAFASRVPPQPRPAANPTLAAATAPLVNASRRTLIVAAATEVAPALAGSGVAAAAVRRIEQLVLAALGKGAGEVRMEFDLVEEPGGQRLTRLVAARQDGSGVILTATPDGSFASEVQQAQLTTELRAVRGEMDATSFYNAAVNAGVTDSLISGFAKAFSYDFNFATDVKPGDIFEAAFEQKVNARGEPVGSPVLVYVSLATAAKSKSLYRFIAPGQTEPGWFDGNGRSTVTALMRTPVDGARITSNFGMRFHPVLHYNRLHGGTDFAAPVGTPVYAAAKGTVVSASPSACAGNMAIIRHADGMETRYFHLSSYAPNVVAGATVQQGVTIGEVGNTGTCTTGPHLHFEVHINGEKVDPMSIDAGGGETLAGDAMVAFRKERDRIDTSRSQSASD